VRGGLLRMGGVGSGGRGVGRWGKEDECFVGGGEWEAWIDGVGMDSGREMQSGREKSGRCVVVRVPASC